MQSTSPTNTPGYFKVYTDLVEEKNLAAAFTNQSLVIKDLLPSITEEKATYAYAPGKWSLKEMLQHIIDAERIFAYRALRIARHDKTPLAGFDENSYAAAANADKRIWEDLLKEFEAVRKSTDLLLQSFTQKQLEQTGTTNGEPNTVKALSFLVFGHILHHINVVKQKYL